MYVWTQKRIPNTDIRLIDVEQNKILRKEIKLIQKILTSRRTLSTSSKSCNSIRSLLAMLYWVQIHQEPTTSKVMIFQLSDSRIQKSFRPPPMPSRVLNLNIATKYFP